MNNHKRIIVEFTKLVNEYCSWAVSKQDPKTDEAFYALKLLSNLYAKALELPDCEATDMLETDEIPDIDYNAIHKQFSKIPFQYYREIFHPLNIENEEPVMGDIADDLADIYKDLKDGLWYINNGSELDAVYYWKFTFGIHWGKHATGALSALHSYCTQ